MQVHPNEVGRVGASFCKPFTRYLLLRRIARSALFFTEAQKGISLCEMLLEIVHITAQ